MIIFHLYSGYMAPEYAMHGYLTDKADVYSFGIVALEIVSGRSNSIPRQKDDSFNLLNWVIYLFMLSSFHVDLTFSFILST